MDVKMKGKPLTTNGQIPAKGEQAPDFTLKDLEGKSVSLSDYKGSVVLISTFPDITTSTCSRQTGTFNDMASTLSDTKIISISSNTVEEQKDWRQAKNIDMDLLHDSDRSFSKNYGLYIEEMDNTARAVLVLDRQGQVVYNEVVTEMSEDPNYEEAVAAAKHEEAELS